MWRFLKKLEIELPYDPAIPLLGIHTKETRTERDTCTPMFIAAAAAAAAESLQSCPTLCDPMNRSTPGLPVYHQLPEFTQTRVHQVSDAIQPSHPLLSPSSPAS